MTTAVLLVLLGVLSRVLPHPFNFSPFGALGLYSGARYPGVTGMGVPIAALVVSDLFLGWGGGHLAVHLSVYATFALIALAGRLARERRRPAFLALLSVASSFFFFLTTNFALWAGETFYPHTAAGLAACYSAGLPLLANTLVADLLGTGALFGLDALFRRRGRLAIGGTIAVALLVAGGDLFAQQPPSVAESVVVTA
ncbi:MAG TPA: DUF6580 family putative transport protein, partial [Thermoanaerobaculia bacterium]